jgi:hypothetical protein
MHAQNPLYTSVRLCSKGFWWIFLGYCVHISRKRSCVVLFSVGVDVRVQTYSYVSHTRNNPERCTKTLWKIASHVFSAYKILIDKKSLIALPKLRGLCQSSVGCDKSAWISLPRNPGLGGLTALAARQLWLPSFI